MIPIYTSSEAFDNKPNKFDVIITDWDLREELEPHNYLKLLRDIAPNTPIIVMTGYDCSGILTDLSNELEFTIVSKPISFIDIAKLVNDLVH